MGLQMIYIDISYISIVFMGLLHIITMVNHGYPTKPPCCCIHLRCVLLTFGRSHSAGNHPSIEQDEAICCGWPRTNSTMCTSCSNSDFHQSLVSSSFCLIAIEIRPECLKLPSRHGLDQGPESSYIFNKNRFTGLRSRFPASKCKRSPKRKPFPQRRRQDTGENHHGCSIKIPWNARNLRIENWGQRDTPRTHDNFIQFCRYGENDDKWLISMVYRGVSHFHVFSVLDDPPHPTLDPRIAWVLPWVLPSTCRASLQVNQFLECYCYCYYCYYNYY